MPTHCSSKGPSLARLSRLTLAGTTLAITLSSAWAGNATSSQSEQLEAQFEAVVLAQLKSECDSESEELLNAQAKLANSLDSVEKATSTTVLLYAVAANSLENAIRLHQSGAPAVGGYGTLLHTAAALSGPEMLEFLTGIGIGIDTVGDAAGTPLMEAVSWNRPDNVEWLIRNGADVNYRFDYQNGDGATALRHALFCKNEEVLDLLKEAGAVPDQQTRTWAKKHGIEMN